VKCLVCRGACCETLEITVPQELPAQHEWASARALRVLGPGRYLVESWCPKLTRDGLCSVQHTKPLECALFPAGGEACLEAVRERRTPAQYAQIRDESDPESVHPAQGQLPECARCRKPKQPRGRSLSPAAYEWYCSGECPGYDEDPRASCRWPGEVECGPGCDAWRKLW